MIPQFNGHGLLPGGLHECNLDAVSAVFCSTPHRAGLFANLKACLAHMRGQGLNGIVVIDGSFVTDKEVPGDIELTLDTRQLPAEDQLRALQYFQAMHSKVKADWNVDWYPTIASLPGIPPANNFIDFFQYAGVKTAAIKGIPAHTPKGILKLEAW
jgi:hypothetical protein